MNSKPCWCALMLVVLTVSLAPMTSAGDKTGDAKRKTEKQNRAAKAGSSLISREQIEDVLDRPCPSVDFFDVPLSEALELLTFDMGNRIQIVIDQATLDSEGLESLDDIMVRRLKLAEGSHTCFAVLELLFAQATSYDIPLTFVPREGHILVTTTDKADEMLEVRVYDLTGLLLESESHATQAAGQRLAKPVHRSSADVPDQQQPRRRQRHGRRRGTQTGGSAARHGSAASGDAEVLKQFGDGGGGGDASLGGMGGLGGMASPVQRYPIIVEAIQAQTSPSALWMEVDGTGGSLSVLGQYLIVQQTYAAHREIEGLLKKLRQAVTLGGPPTGPGVRSGATFGGGGMLGGGGGMSGSGFEGGGGGMF